MRKCNLCGNTLTNENWSPNSKFRRYYICKDCGKQLNAKWCKEHKEERTRFRKENYLCIQGKQIKVNKRLYPEDNKCELCKKPHKKLDYHHWDDEHPEYGLWLCPHFCHFLGEALDKNPDFVSKYFDLKISVSSRYGTADTKKSRD
jgi:hypothetical protein